MNDLRRVYRYYFLDDNPEMHEEPLIYCPSCESDLTKDHSVLVDFGGPNEAVYMTKLLSGVLQDTPKTKIMLGGFSTVKCEHCGAELGNLDNVYEEEMTF